MGERLLADVSTGSDGVAAVPIGTLRGGGATLRAEAAGYLPYHRRIAATETQVDAPMAKGDAIRGRVVDARGTGIADASLRFHRAGALISRRLAMEPGSDDPPVSGSFSARSDAEGYFAVTVPGDVDLELDVVADGWATRRPTDFPEVKTPGATGEAVRTASTVDTARAGPQELLVVMFPVRAFRGRFLDSETRGRVAGYLGNVQPLLPPSAGRSRLIEAHRAGLRPMQERAETALDFDGVVTFERLEAVQREIELYVQVDGYEPAVARVPLQLPSALAANTATSEVFLVPGEGLGSAEVEFELPARGGSARLALGSAVRTTSLIGGEWWRTHSAERVRNESWLTRRIPAGTQTLRFFDGLGWSSPVQVRLLEGGRTSVRPEFPPLTGITLDVRDARGEPVFGGTFSIGSTTSEEEATAESRALSATGRSLLRFGALNEPERSPADGQRLWQFLALTPGRFVWVFERPGFSEVTGSLTLRSGEIQRLVIPVSRAP